MRRWLPFEWIAAIRFLLEGKVQSLFIIAGISIGVGVIIFMSALLSGLQSNIIKRILNAQAHIVLRPPDEVVRPLRFEDGVQQIAIVQRPTQRLRSIDQWQKIQAELGTWSQVSQVSPMAAGSALAVRGDASRSISLLGIEPERYFTIVKLPEDIVSGQPRLTSEDVIIGVELAKELGIGVGDRMRVTAATGNSATLTVTGLFDLGNKVVNERNVYVALRTAQALLGLIGGTTSIDVTVDDIYAAETIARQIQRSARVEADSWIETNAQFFTAINAQIISNTTIRILVGLSIAFGIASVLVVSVVQKSKEIGILRAMGATRGQVLRVFLIQGGILGFGGSIFGSGLAGIALLLWYNYARNPDGTQFFPITPEPTLFIVGAVLATLTGVAAAMTPALRASRLNPVVAIRG